MPSPVPSKSSPLFSPLGSVFHLNHLLQRMLQRAQDSATFFQLAASYPDFFLQLSLLLHDPLYHDGTASNGQGKAILLIPGFLTGDWTLWIMAGWLQRLGYRPYLSGLNFNIDCPNKTAAVLRQRLDYVADETSGPLTVVGHSLGGMLGRFLGVNFPDKVQHVIAIGSPIDGTLRVNPLVPFAFRVLQKLRPNQVDPAAGCGSAACSCQFARTTFSPVPQPVRFTAIFTKQDEIVHWQTCIDPQGKNIQVPGRHLGLIVNRHVYRNLAAILPGHH